MKNLIEISKSLSLPLEVVTEATAIVATRGAGKSSASAVVVEETIGLGVQSVIFDRTGVYWGLRSNAKGTAAGLPIYILGGPHGDVPLEPHAGVLIANLVVDSGHSFVLDLSDFSKGAAVKFAADFLERLYDRKARSRSTTLVVIDEAHFYAPQTPRGGFKGDSARLMGAMEDVVGLGRSRGLGVVLTTQRTQSLNKAVLELIETLLVMRMLSPRARGAVRDWIQEKHEEDELGVIASLDSLPTGTAWVWSPLRGILEKVAVRRIKTFDSYATPKPGETRVEPSARKQLDLDALGEEMRSTAERAKANDPAELKRRVRELEKKLAERDATQDVDTGELVELREQLANAEQVAEELDQELHESLERGPYFKLVAEILDELQDFHERALSAFLKKREELSAPTRPRVAATASSERAQPRDPEQRPPVAARPPARPPARPTPVPTPAADSDDGPLPLGASKLLTVLAQFPAGRTRKQLGVLAGYKASGSSFRGAIAELRRLGYASPPNVDPIVATPAGLAAAPAGALPLGRDLYDYWIRNLPEAARKMLEVLYDAWPDGVSRDDLGERCGYDPKGSSFRGGIAALRNVDLATPAGVEPIRASDELMQEQAA